MNRYAQEEKPVHHGIWYMLEFSTLQSCNSSLMKSIQNAEWRLQIQYLGNNVQDMPNTDLPVLQRTCFILTCLCCCSTCSLATCLVSHLGHLRSVVVFPPHVAMCCCIQGIYYCFLQLCLLTDVGYYYRPANKSFNNCG